MREQHSDLGLCEIVVQKGKKSYYKLLNLFIKLKYSLLSLKFNINVSIARRMKVIIGAYIYNNPLVWDIIRM